MNKFFSGLLGALALCAVVAPVQAAPAPSAPVAIAVFHPDEQASPVQTVQYRRGYAARRAFHRRAYFAHRGPYHRGPRYARAPFRRY